MPKPKAKAAGKAAPVVAKVDKPKVVKSTVEALSPEDKSILENTPLKFPKGVKPDKRLRLARLLKRPAAAKRPRCTLKPVGHAGGRVFYAKRDHQFRAYKRSSDKIEESVAIAVGDVEDQKNKFLVSCAMIEADPRPVE